MGDKWSVLVVALLAMTTGAARAWSVGAIEGDRAEMGRITCGLVEKYGPSGQSPPRYLYTIMQKESAYNPHDVSYADAIGLLQMVPPTTRRVAQALNIEFREGGEDSALPTDFAHYAQVDIGGPDPNGLGYLGYDNTPGRDMQNRRLYDRIGGVNAVTQNDGAPGYGGVFAEQLLGFSSHPGTVTAIKSAPGEAELFDQVFDPLRPDVGGTPATVREATLLPALSSGSI